MSRLLTTLLLYRQGYIDIYHSEFVGVNMIKFAYLNGIKILG